MMTSYPSTISPSLYRSVVAQNSQGIQHLDQRDFKEALSCFQRGLQILLRGISESEALAASENTQRTSEESTIASSNDEEQTFERNTLTTVELPSEGNEVVDQTNYLLPQRDEHDDIFVMFTRSIRLPLQMTEICDNSDADYSRLLPSILSYNVGFVHHSFGLQLGRSFYLRKALNFYSLALTSLMDQLSQSLESKSAASQLVHLAITNNIAHIHAYFCGFTEVAICRDEMSLCLSEYRAVSDGEDSTSLSFRYRSEYKIFLLNILLFRRLELAAAPAA